MKRELHILVASVVACAMLAGCGTMTPTERPQDPAPDYKAIVLGYLQSEPDKPKKGEPDKTTSPDDLASGPGQLFKAPQKFGLVELSPATLVQHDLLGWIWLTCLRTHPIGKPASDYALFIKGGRIADARLSVATDHCTTQSYEPLGRFFKKLDRPDKDPATPSR